MIDIRFIEEDELAILAYADYLEEQGKIEEAKSLIELSCQNDLSYTDLVFTKWFPCDQSDIVPYGNAIAHGYYGNLFGDGRGCGTCSLRMGIWYGSAIGDGGKLAETY